MIVIFIYKKTWKVHILELSHFRVSQLTYSMSIN